jgi:hypothetical protein
MSHIDKAMVAQLVTDARLRIEVTKQYIFVLVSRILMYCTKKASNNFSLADFTGG